MEFRREIIVSPNGRELKKFYSAYKKVFTLREEQESYSGFKRVMGFNKRKDLKEKYGFFEEVIINYLLKGEVIAAVNFSVYSMPSFIKKRYGIDATSHIIYIFVDKKYREHGLGSRLLLDAEKTARKIMKGKTMFFIDENNPRKMSIKERKESYRCGTSEKKRILWWENHGFKELDFNYIQLPLGLKEKACKYLMLAVRTRKNNIPSEIVKEHLERYFSLSVLKGQEAENNVYFKKEKRELEKKFVKTRLF